MPDHTYTADHEREAFALGAAAGLSAASWVADGNTSDEHIIRVLAMLDAGDPEADEYLPAMPDLSGEWADAPTPRSLFEEITGFDAHAEASWNYDAYLAVLEPICDAWEAGVASTFESECERILRAMAPDPEDLEDVLRAYVACALWSSHDFATEDGGEPMDANYGPEDIAPETLASMREDVAAFLSDTELAEPLAFWREEFGAEQIGHDFWLTRNGHGAGFWDRLRGEQLGRRFGQVLTDAARAYGTVDLYVGDDGRIHS